MFIILSGSSGVGKNTVIKHLMEKTDKIVLMPTFTTRGMRDGEVEGSPYFYISKEEFQNKIKNNDFIEYEFIHNNYYGSTYSIFDEYIKSGKILIKDIGVEGAQNLDVKLSDRTELVKIFLTTKHKRELKERLKGREEKQIKLRLKRYDYEQKQKNKFDFIIYNEDLTETTETIKTIVLVSMEDYIPTKKLRNISKYKVRLYKNKLLCGKKLKPVKIAIQDGKIYVVSGVERFVAGLLTGKTVAKVIVHKKVKETSVEKDWYKELA